jgi:hypothetical protein
MGYIKPPEPADEVVIYEGDPESGTPAFTWGDHRQMLKFLQESEASDEAIAAAGRRLEEALASVGYKEPELICEFCHRKEGQPHEPECRDHDDPSMWAKREAGGYQYLDDGFRIVHTTSVPMTDEEALEYFSVVQLMFTGEPDLWVRYIKRREINSVEYKMIPWQYNKDVGEVFPIEQRS